MNEKKNTRPKWVRIVAVLVVIILVVMILATLICAFAGADKSIIMGLLLCDLIIPIFIWAFLFVTKRLINQRKEAGHE
ncbi:MAG: phosphate ABC transporter substrate-binding protein [Lachnospiraceae bacterium]|nr:phosphate ABC transporter substrate-binding protein [Lachnospiraceae bacterium]